LVFILTQAYNHCKSNKKKLRQKQNQFFIFSLTFLGGVGPVVAKIYFFKEWPYTEI